MLQVHEFPPFNTSRTGEGSWVMTNHIGTFTCKVSQLPESGQVLLSCLPGAADWSALADQSVLSGPHDIGSLFGWVICARKSEPAS